MSNPEKTPDATELNAEGAERSKGKSKRFALLSASGELVLRIELAVPADILVNEARVPLGEGSSVVLQPVDTEQRAFLRRRGLERLGVEAIGGARGAGEQCDAERTGEQRGMPLRW